MDEQQQISLLIEDPALRRAQESICTAVQAAGGQAFLVGGSVRDAVAGLPIREIDIEVYGLDPERLTELLAARFKIDLVGEAFGVIKIRQLPIDVSIPRRESQIGLGHRGFEVLADPQLPMAEAAARRDFTINAMAFDPLTGELHDPHGGRSDLAARLLRHTSEKFVEDPLRVLRGMQFAARFQFEVAPPTVALCRSISPAGLAAERIMDEWRKLILLGKQPSRGLQFLQDCDWLRHFPELAALVGCRQDPSWHPEGDVWLHTLHCMDAFAGERINDEWEDLIVGFAVLCHDFGKPATTICTDQKISSARHDVSGEAPTQSFLRRLTSQRDLINEVVALVGSHMRPVDLYDAQAGDSAIRRLARRVRRIDRLVRVARADQMGRPPRPFTDFPAGDWLLRRARELAVADAAPRALVLGRHLIELGLAPGPRFGTILATCYEAQIEGEITTLEEGIEFARRLVAAAGDELD